MWGGITLVARGPLGQLSSRSGASSTQHEVRIQNPSPVSGAACSSKLKAQGPPPPSPPQGRRTHINCFCVYHIPTHAALSRGASQPAWPSRIGGGRRQPQFPQAPEGRVAILEDTLVFSLVSSFAPLFLSMLISKPSKNPIGSSFRIYPAPHHFSPPLGPPPRSEPTSPRQRMMMASYQVPEDNSASVKM